MVNSQKIQRIYELVRILNKASDACYYSHEQDILYDELVTLERETDIVLANSPTQNVGSELSTATCVENTRHEISIKPMDKTKDINALMAFIGAHQGIMNWKLDGLTVILTYDNGRLMKAATCEENDVSEIITENVKFFTGVPFKIPYQGRLNVCGKVVIPRPYFKKANVSLSEWEEFYKILHDFVTTSIQKLDFKEIKRCHICFITFASDHEEKTRDEEFAWLESQGFPVVVSSIIRNNADVPGAVKNFRKIMPANPLPVSGLVLRFNETDYGKSLNTTDKFARDAIAFEW